MLLRTNCLMSELSLGSFVYVSSNEMSFDAMAHQFVLILLFCLQNHIMQSPN